MNAEEKFREIYEEYKNMILKIVYDRTGDYHIAQDICQETFARLYGYQNDINLDMVKGWLIVVASHLASDYKKKGSRRRGVPTDISRDSDDCALEEEVARHLERAEHRRLCGHVLKALREKNEDWYDVLMLVEYLGVPRKAVAKKRGVSLSMIDYYLRKAKKWMKDNFQKEYDEL